MKKVGHTSEFCLGIYWWTWKTTITKNKKVRILTFTMYFLKIHIYKNTRNHHQCHSILTILFYFFFLEGVELKIKIFKKWKKHPGDIIILQRCTTNHIWFLVLEISNAINGYCLCHFGPMLPFYHNNGLKNQVWKMEKTPGDINLHLRNKNHDMNDVHRA